MTLHIYLHFIFNLSFFIIGSSDKCTLVGDVVVSFLKIALSTFCDQADYSKKLTARIFPLLLIFPKVCGFYAISHMWCIS